MQLSVFAFRIALKILLKVNEKWILLAIQNKWNKKYKKKYYTHYTWIERLKRWKEKWEQSKYIAVTM